jgi:hypothetical protein
MLDMKETLVRLLRSHPFQPFVVQMSNGERFEVRHPEMAALQKSNLIVSCPDSDQFEVCALLHIANITTNDSASSVP